MGADRKPSRRVAEELRSWLHPAVLGVCGLAAASGFGSFAVTAALGEVAEEFGEATPDDGVAAEIGMTATTIGVALALVRLASVASLPMAALADRVGRRRVLVACIGMGLAVTGLASVAPTFWVFIGLLALARPLLSTTNVVAGVVAAEQTTKLDRAKAVALVGAAYAVGTGIIALARGAFAEPLGLRGVFALMVVPLLLLPLLVRPVEEPSRFVRLQRSDRPRKRLWEVRPDLWGRLAIVCALSWATGFATGPLNTYLFLFGERVVGVGPWTMSIVFVSAGGVGLGGLLVGRWSADRYGRRPTAAVSLAGVAASGMVTYSGMFPALVVGFFLTTVFASALTPSAGTLNAEIFPTSVRSTAGGWLTTSQVLGAVSGLATFGALVDALEAFRAAAVAIAVPVVLLSALYALLPETRGLELEESAPEQHPTP